MSTKIKRSIIISIIIIFIILIAISSFFIVKYFSDKNKISNIYETYSDDNIQNRIETQNVTTDEDLMLEIDGEKVVGVIKIDKIGYEGPIYEEDIYQILHILMEMYVWQLIIQVNFGLN